MCENETEEKSECDHENCRVIREGITGTMGTVVCQDCGHEREWGAY